MYINVPAPTAGRRPRHPSISVSFVRPCSCGCGASALGEPVVERRTVKDADVPVTSATKATKGVARRVRNAVVKMSWSFDPVLQNTAQRIVNGDVTIRFVGDLQPVTAPEAVMTAAGVPAAQITDLLKNNTLVDIPRSDPALVPKRGTFRAFERNGVIYIPTDADDAQLLLDIVHEVNHALNPVTIDATRDPAGYLWEKFKAEVRAAYVANFRDVKGDSDKGAFSLRFEKAIEHARQHAVNLGWTTQTGWDPAFLERIRSWTPDGNLDNRK
jgi:hypothetical protein